MLPLPHTAGATPTPHLDLRPSHIAVWTTTTTVWVCLLGGGVAGLICIISVAPRRCEILPSPAGSLLVLGAIIRRVTVTTDDATKQQPSSTPKHHATAPRIRAEEFPSVNRPACGQSGLLRLLLSSRIPLRVGNHVDGVMLRLKPNAGSGRVPIKESISRSADVVSCLVRRERRIEALFIPIQ